MTDTNLPEGATLTSTTDLVNPPLPEGKVAFIIDGVVEDVLHVPDRLAAILLSNPTIVDVKAEFDKDPNVVLQKATYDAATGTFALKTQDEIASALQAEGLTR